MIKPTCIIVTGRPGSGKTTLASELGRQLWMPVVGRDAIKEGYVNTFGVKHDRLPPETNGVVTQLFFQLVARYLEGMVSVVVEAAFQHHVWAPEAARLRKLADVRVIICDVDAEVAARRHLERGLADPRREFYHGDRRVSLFRETGTFEPGGSWVPLDVGDPTLVVSTADGYVPGMKEIIAWIGEDAPAAAD